MSSIYVNDSKKKTVRQYSASSEVIQALETLLKNSEDIVWSETHTGFAVAVKQIEEELSNKPKKKTRSDEIDAIVYALKAERRPR